VAPADEVLATLLEEAIEVTSSHAKRSSVQITFQVESGFVVYCIASQLSQVLVNLFNNAIDAVRDLDDRWVRVTAERDTDDVVIRVVDGGAGIPSEVSERIMKPYFTTKPRGLGTGLGLSISRSLIESRGGSLSLDTDAAHTTFVIRLPAKSRADLQSIA
jgi:C4-dicarboxylate-specific signal transduction histidine kinase